MSYDLYLKPRRSLASGREALAYLGQRKHYDINAEHGQAFYENEDTGVHFQFGLNDDEPDSSIRDYPYFFQINFFRPSHFILEAALEVTEFVRHFDCTVLEEDALTGAEAPYFADRLIERWNHGNEFAYRAVLTEHPEMREGLLTLPTTRLTEIWRWNHRRKALQDEIGNHVFVPMILILRADGQPKTAIVWGDGIPTLLPTVDLVLIHRQKLTRWRPFGRESNRALMPWPDLTSLVATHAVPHASGALLLTYDQPPKVVTDHLRALPIATSELEWVSGGTVLDREIVERALS
jgi:hypothetical protein